MLIRSFKGRNAAEALQKVKAGMGPDALIIQTRPVRDRGLLGMFRKTGVEIVAAVDGPRKSTGDSTSRTYIADTGPARGSGGPQIESRKPPSPFDQLAGRLVKVGVDPHLAGELSADVRQLSEGLRISEPGRLSAALADVLKKRIRTTGGLGAWTGYRRIVAFVGPTGVGKTTTIAKLAADLSLRRGRRVELLTIDAHRVAAVEQLKSCGELIGIPVHAAYTAGEFADAVKRAARAEFILIDTPGCSRHDTEALVQLEQYFRQVPQLEVNVLLSCCCKLDDAAEAVGAFRSIAGRMPAKGSLAEPLQLLFTKLDETSSRGSLLTVATRSHLPISYLCDGQEIPDDIEVTTPDILSKLLVGDSGPSLSCGAGREVVSK